ncbi:sulfotransferase family 2 domain-containing protein [Aestuariicoccus sp. MJ-SS9]|uniref:sulfotransferase family 2 domain-containing protein n=1 Tax=Aestuariicoccus sp. MJ-SS9 TaxID=3079855 RepID=UPI00290CCF2B|nr:sulfotransferase family 2 domain-containing protein [Aestuariicoccus sp. MJ-SS9]MDU8909909.1 sulfotransferase family 2 domain-containing protein [Aestuariicoccus sp. MJ-SS9]
MIVSPGRGYIFVHIPKTGGTSMALALEARAMADDILIGDTPKARRRKGRLAQLTARGRLWKHSTLADIDGVLTPAEIAGMFTFTLVRNPWDRLVSYYHWLRAQRFDHPAVTLAQSLGFADFLTHPQTVGAITANPYGSYMRDAGGTERASAYLRLEHLSEDIAPLAEHLGFTPALPHRNRSARAADFRGYYTDALAEHAAALCAEDIARFDYRFDPPFH